MDTPPIAQIAKALAAAQGEFGPVVKNRTANVKSDKGNYTYDYADLATVLEAVRPVLCKHGLALTSVPGNPNSGKVGVRTLLLHESGESLEAYMEAPCGPRLQDAGTAITYLRRYTISSLLGIASEEDDDANGPETGGKTAPREAQSKGKAEPAKTKPAGDEPQPRAELQKLVLDLAKQRGVVVADGAAGLAVVKAVLGSAMSELGDAKVSEALTKFRSPSPKLLDWMDSKLRSAGLLTTQAA